MAHSCHSEPGGHKDSHPKMDKLLWGSVSIVTLAYLSFAFASEKLASSLHLHTFAESVFDLINVMDVGMVMGVVVVGLLSDIPRGFIAKMLGKGGTFSGVLRATMAGVLLDLCSHGILMVGMQLYKKGASLGQTMAFLIASPWNSLSLTFILWALIGLKWTLAFLFLSMLIAIISGVIFDRLEERRVLAKNPYQEGENAKVEQGSIIPYFLHSLKHPLKTLWTGLKQSRMILRWIFFGIVLAALVRTFVNPETFQTFFGPTLGGLGLTLIIATVLEVCSEGSTPIAADLLTRAKAPGNSFAFLMAGVSTDYTEILILRETTRSWKTSFFLPLITLPQILIIAWLMNGGG